MSPEVWLLFLVSELVLCLTPGPAVLLGVSQGMRHGFGASAAGSAGLLSVNALWFALSAVGLGGVLLASATLFGVVKWAGAAYLVYLGLRMVVRSFARDGGTEGGTPPEPVRRGRVFSQGVLAQLANPKAAVFFTALLPQFVSPEGNTASCSSRFWASRRLWRSTACCSSTVGRPRGGARLLGGGRRTASSGWVGRS